MNKAIEQKINKIYWALFKKVYNTSSLTALAKGNKRQIRQAVLKLQSSKQFDTFAKKFSKALAKQGLYGAKGVWRKYFDAAKASNHIALSMTYKEYEMKNISNAVKHNFDMIKSIPDKFLDILKHDYTSTLIEQVAKGSIGRNSFKTQLEKHGHKNAALIARTETAKLQTAIMEERATQLGSIAYIWLSSNDKRTRQSHKDMNGVVVFWKKPKPQLDGLTGHAGEYPNCRCSPEPIVAIDDLTRHTYSVYDYNSHKVIKMSKQELINSLELGQLTS